MRAEDPVGWEGVVVYPWHRGISAGLLLLLCIPLTAPGQAGEEPKKGKAPEKGPGEVLYVVEQLADVLKMVPRAVLLPPDKYQDLLAEVARLQKQVEAEKAMRPNYCTISGKLEPGRLQLTLRFVIVPERAGSVWLACGKKVPITKATLDGNPAPIRSEADGLHVAIDGPGKTERVVVLEATVPIQPKGALRLVELELPRAAVTKIADLELPPGLKDLRIGENVHADALPVRNNRLTDYPLGAPDRLQMTWREPQFVAGPMVATAEGAIEVVVDERQQTTTTATLTLQMQSGRTSSWRLLLPPGAEVKVPEEVEPRLAGIDRNDQPFARLTTIRFKESTSDPLTVTVSVPRGTIPRGQRLAVGPFVVLGAARQTGSILVRSSARDLQLQASPAIETTPRALSAEEQNLAPYVRAFKYDRVPQPEKPKTATGPGSYSLLDLEAESVLGVIETRMTHTVRLPRERPRTTGEEPEAMEPRCWEVTTVLRGRLIQPGVEILEVQLPAGSQRVERMTSVIRPPLVDVKLDAERNVLQLWLERDGWKEFSYTFTVRYAVTAELPEGEAVARATLPLPQPRKTERGQSVPATSREEFLVQVIVPDDLELIQPEKPNPTLEVVQVSPQEQTWRPDPTADRLGEEVTLAWRPYQPEVQATATVDLTLTPHEVRVWRHEIRLRLPRLAQRVLNLHLPQGLKQARLVQGGMLLPANATDPIAGTERTMRVQLDGNPGVAGSGEREAVLVLDYSVPLPVGPVGQGGFAVPLVVAEATTRLQTIVRIWSEPGMTPIPLGKNWIEQPLEEVAGVRRLPGLVLRAEGVGVPLSLRYAESQGRLPAVVARRALIRVLVQEGQGHYYQVGYLLQQTTARTLDVEMPAAVASLPGLRFTLDGNQIDHEIVDDQGDLNESGRIARLRMPTETRTKPAMLEVVYQWHPRGATSPLATLLQPPLLRCESAGSAGGPAPAAPPILARWAISLPSGWVTFGPEEGPGTRRTWSRRGALLVPRPDESLADLEAWLAGADVPAREPDPALASPTLVCWRTGVTALTVYHAPQQIWLLLCSLTVLAVGLGFVFWWRRVLRDQGSPSGLLIALVVLALGPTVASLWYPTLLSAILLGCEPGLVVLVIVVVLQWWVHERERRQVLFPTSFTRNRQPSTVNRPEVPRTGPRPQTEPSTVDVPPASGS